MGKLHIKLPDGLEKQLRMEALRRFDGKKGALSRAITDACKQWIATQKRGR